MEPLAPMKYLQYIDLIAKNKVLISISYYVNFLNVDYNLNAEML